MQLLDLARDRIPADPQPLSRFHFPATREVECLTDHRSLKPAREFVHDIGGILAQQSCDLGPQPVFPHAGSKAGKPLTPPDVAFDPPPISTTDAVSAVLSPAYSWVGVRSGGKSFCSIVCAGAITVSQLHRFSSCRTLPGNGSDAKNPSASSDTRFGSTPRSRALFCRKCRVSSGMSSLRSRNAGKRKRMTFSR